VSSRVFRLPRSAYLAVLILAIGATALVQHPLAAFVYVVPLLAAAFIARTATIVDERGITVRALIGRRSMPWEKVRGLSVTGRNVYAVIADAAVRLPCVRVSDLAALSAASGGRLPQVRESTPKYAPSGRRGVSSRHSRR
jgi:hypothetical protein